MKKKSVEWKDTRLPFSAEYSYSLFVRNRCVFFYCLARNVRKMINYAANFVHPAAICVIYVYGAVKPETVKKQLAEKPWHILMLIASGISSEDIEAVSEYRKWLEVLKKQGFLKITKQGVPKSKYSSVLVCTEYGNEPSERWYNQYNRPEWESGYRVYTEGVELMERHRNVSKRITDAQYGRLDVLANFPTVDTADGNPETHDWELLNIIRRLYPYGVEADTTDETAVKLLKIRRLFSAAFQDEITPDVKKLNIHFADGTEQLCFWNTVTEGASKCLEFLEKYCSEGISERGCLSLSEMWFQLSMPPYGAYMCNWYCYIYALALKKYNTSDYFYGGSMSAKRNDNFLPNLDPKYLYGFIFVQNEKQEKFKRLLAKLFDIEEPPEATRMLITEVAMGWITDNIKWAPLDCIDHRFYEIFSEYGREYDIPHVDYSRHLRAWYEFGYEKYLPWLEENFDDLYVRIRKLDENFHKALAKKYGQKRADLYCKCHTVKGGAVGWLHTKELLEEGVKAYMESLVCSECGNHIGVYGQIDFGYQAIEVKDGNTEVYDFSKKDIIGLNKKLLGRNRTDYLCVPCLAEYTESSEVELWHIMHDFKELGCELFT